MPGSGTTGKRGTSSKSSKEKKEDDKVEESTVEEGDKNEEVQKEVENNSDASDEEDESDEKVLDEYESVDSEFQVEERYARDSRDNRSRMTAYDRMQFVPKGKVTRPSFLEISERSYKRVQNTLFDCRQAAIWLEQARPFRADLRDQFDLVRMLREVVMLEVAKSGNLQQALDMVAFVCDREALYIAAKETGSLDLARKAVWDSSPADYPQLAAELRSQRELRARRRVWRKAPQRNKQKFEYFSEQNVVNEKKRQGQKGPGYYETLGKKEKTPLKELKFKCNDDTVGSMSAMWYNWKRLKAPRRLVQWLRSGVPLRWRGKPPEQKTELNQKSSEEAEEELKKQVERGAFIEAKEAVISPTFVIPKRSGGCRLIHDLRKVNKSLDPPSFSLRGVRDASEVVRKSNWIVALDLKQGYNQILVAERDRRFLGAKCGDKIVVATTLPFGLSISPFIFTRATSFLARQIRKRTGAQVAVYIDDFLIGGKTKRELKNTIQEVERLFKFLGVRLSEKTSREPARKVEFLGFYWNSKEKTISVTKDRAKEYRKRIKCLLKGKSKKKEWLSAIGKLVFLRDAVGLAMRHTRSLLTACRGKKKEDIITPQGESLVDLNWWLSTLKGDLKLVIQERELTAVVATDASDVALGGVIEVWSQGRQEKKVSMREEIDPHVGHINLKEAMAFRRLLQKNLQRLKGRKIVWYSDSMVARAIVARQGSQNISKELWEEAKSIIDLLDVADIQVVAKHTPGRLNVGPDSLSRPGLAETEWRQALQKIIDRWGPMDIEPFGFTKPGLRTPELGEWRDKRALLIPDVRDISKTLNLLEGMKWKDLEVKEPKLRKRLCVLVTPEWVGTNWYQRLRRIKEDQISLGKLDHPQMRNYVRRNGSKCGWIASLVKPILKLSRPQQGIITVQS